MNSPIVIGGAVLHLGDCIEVMKTLADASVDSIVTDPPYHLTSTSRCPHKGHPDTPHGRARIGDRGFMGKTWDGGDIAHNVEMWTECLRVLKPGGHLLAFSGTRTQHRMVCAIEDAGFEVRDQIGWLYGSGFPKSRNLSGDWNGWGSALKPAWEPICVARKPLVGTLAQNVMEFGTGAFNIDSCRVELDGDYKSKANGRPSQTGLGDNYDHAKANQPDTIGRWPANLIHDGSPEVLAAFPDAPGQLADSSTNADARKTQNTYGAMRRGRGDESSADSENDGTFGFKMKPGARRLDSGSAARFFYCAKTSRTDRHEGMNNPGPVFKSCSTLRDAENLGSDRPGNNHPTVKPTDLMAYLCRLVTPPGGTVLDPFMGSGSTGKAAALEEFSFIGIDMTPEYIEIAKARIKHAQAQHVQQRMFA